MRLSGAQIQAFIRGSLFSTSHRPYPLRTDLRVLVSTPCGLQAGLAPGAPELTVRSGVLTGALCLSPFALPTLAGPPQVPEPVHMGGVFIAKEPPTSGGAISLHPQGPLPWSHPTSPLPGRAGSTPTLLTCLCTALPECQADSWPPLWGSSVLFVGALSCLL